MYCPMIACGRVTGDDAWWGAKGVEDIVFENFGKSLIVGGVSEQKLLVSAAIVDVVVRAWDKDSLTVNAGHIIYCIIFEIDKERIFAQLAEMLI